MDTAALALGIVGMFACTVCTVAFYAGMAISAVRAGQACKSGAVADCVIGIGSTMLGGAGRVGVRAGLAMSRAGARMSADGSVVRAGWLSDSGRWVRGVSNAYGYASTALSGVGAYRTWRG